MIFIPPAQNFREKMDKIESALCKILESMPRKTETQEKFDSLQNTVVSQSDVIKKLQNQLNSMMSLNEELIQYIDNIEQVKSAGGVRTECYTRHDFAKPVMYRIKKVTIPEFSFGILDYDNP